jgi:uracil-DNA glycosylase
MVHNENSIPAEKASQNSTDPAFGPERLESASQAGNLDSSWRKFLEKDLQSDRMKELKQFLKSELKAGKIIYPKRNEYFAALNTTPLESVKVVILGQDPYHGAGQAHGLSFSVKRGILPPPSLVNIFKELEADLGVPRSKDGDLTCWARQGVLLLNSVLTVESARAASHQGRGWELFTDRIIQVLNEHRDGLVFVLWGAYAQKKAAFVDREKHLVLEGPHPSPLSSYRGFFGSKPFSKINRWLESRGETPIDWRLS